MDEKELLEEIEAFLQRTGMAATRFGIEAADYGHLVFRLRAGKPILSSTVRRVRDYMRLHQKKVA